MLKVIDIHTYYGESYTLRGVSLDVGQGFVVALLGRNGMGKTTTVRSIIGFTPPRRGTIKFKNKEITNTRSYQIARMGMGLIPAGRQIFPSLSVEENLTMAARTRGKDNPWSLEKIYSLFPVLKARSRLRGHVLSGGEQQMLTISRALMTNPDLLLMDEPLEGLSPLFVIEINNTIEKLKESGFSILLIEQNLPAVLKVADIVYLMNKGEIVYQGTIEEFKENEGIRDKYLGVSG